MKRILFILSFLFLSVMSFSQVFTNPRSSSSITVQDPRLSVPMNLYIPRLGDTTLAGGLDSLGAIIYDRLRHKVWIRDTILTGGHHWLNLLTDTLKYRFGIEDNISDLDRDINFNNNSISIDSVYHWRMSAHTHTYPPIINGMYGSFDFSTQNLEMMTRHYGSGIASYGFYANPTLSTLFYQGANQSSGTFVQTDSIQVILESDPYRFYLYHDSVSLTRIDSGILDFRLRKLPYNGSNSLRMLVIDSLNTGRVYTQSIPTVDTMNLATKYDLTLANNGLSRSVDSTQLGGALTHNTTISNGGLILSMTGTNANELMNMTNSGGGRVILGSSIDAPTFEGSAVNASVFSGISTNGVPVNVTSINNAGGEFSISPSNANSVITNLQLLRATSGTAASGIGQRIDFYTQTTGGSSLLSNRLISKLSNATTGSQTAQFIINGANAGSNIDLFTLSGNGQAQLNQYTSTNFQTIDTSFNSLVVDGSGNIYKRAGGGGGGTGSQTLQQVFNSGSLLTKADTVYQSNNILLTTGQFINGDTINSGYIGAFLTFGVSIDLGLVTGDTMLATSWVQQVSGAMGLFNWDRAHSGTTLIQHFSGDSSMQNMLYSIPNYSLGVRYIVIGNYTVNDCQLSDSTTYRAALIAMIDSLHINRGYPLANIVGLTGTPAPSRGAPLPLLATAALHVYQEKGVRYFDSYTYLNSDHSNVYRDSIHLSQKGQINLAKGILNSLATLDTVNYVRANNIQVEQALTVNGRSYFNSVFNAASDSVRGNMAIGGTLNLTGNVVNATTFNKGIIVTGDAVLNDQRWLAYRNGNQRYGVGVVTTTGNWLRLFSDGFSGDGVQMGQISTSDGSTFTEYFHVNNTETKAFNSLVGTSGANISGTTTLSNVSITGANSIGQEWNLFSNSGLKFGVRMDGASPYYTHIYTGYNVSTNAVSLDWMDSDGTTLHPIFRAQKNGLLVAPSYGSGANTGTPAFGLSVTSGGSIIETAIPSADSAIWKNDGAMDANHTLSGNGKILNLGSSGSKLLNLNMNASGLISFAGQFLYSIDAYSTDADHTVTSTAQICEITDALSTNRTLTLPTATLNGTVVTVVMHFSSGTNHFNLSAAVTDNATGSTFTQLDWGKTYDFLYDSGLAWRLIRKY